MAIWNVQCEFGAVSNLPEDRIVYTFNFEGSPTATDTANIDDMLWDFFDTPQTTWAPTDRMSNQVFNGDVLFKIYCQEDPAPRPPRAEYEHSFSPIASPTLPAEVALCLSYHAATVAGQSQARRRGRVYLGPFLQADDASGRPDNDIITMVLAQASHLLAEANASVTWEWIVWSRAAAAGYEVTGGWCDDAWDTQRRRGPAPTSRTTWS